MKQPVRIAVWLVLAVILGFSILRPHQMVSPGDLIPAHAGLTDDCFACHAVLRGADAQRCITCHKVGEIGLRTTKGLPIPRKPGRTPFHQALTEPDCMACHSDHPAPRLSPARSVRFNHDLLRANERSKCQTCHLPPRDTLHRNQNAPCATCHALPQWKPATFNHDRFFRLDRDHNVPCTTCHLGANYQRYTCYGCHEHRQAQIIAEHREEGITLIDNCVRCHRSAQEREHGGEGGRQRGDDDD